MLLKIQKKRNNYKYMEKTTLNLFVLFLTLTLAQVVVFNNICLYDIAVPIVFIYFILRAPISLNINIFLSISFILGLTIDIFSNTQGLHSLSCTIIAFIKRDILRLYVARDEEIANDYVSIKTIGFPSFFKFSLTMILIYCLIVFCVESFTFFNFIKLITKIAASAIFSLVIILGIDRIAYKRREKRL